MQTNPEQTYVCKLISMFKLINSSVAVMYTRTEVQVYKKKRKTSAVVHVLNVLQKKMQQEKNCFTMQQKVRFYSAAESKVLQCSIMKNGSTKKKTI